jgi:hypothetical protein
MLGGRGFGRARHPGLILLLFSGAGPGFLIRFCLWVFVFTFRFSGRVSRTEHGF